MHAHKGSSTMYMLIGRLAFSLHRIHLRCNFVTLLISHIHLKRISYYKSAPTPIAHETMALIGSKVTWVHSTHTCSAICRAGERVNKSMCSPSQFHPAFSQPDNHSETTHVLPLIYLVCRAAVSSKHVLPRPFWRLIKDKLSRLGCKSCFGSKPAWLRRCRTCQTHFVSSFLLTLGKPH